MTGRVRLRGARRHEGHHLHPGGAVLRADRRLHDPGDLHLAAADRQPDPGLGLFSACTKARRHGGELLVALDQVLTDLGFKEYTATTTCPCRLNMALYTLSLMIGTAGLPHVIIRFFTVPKVPTRAGRPAGRWCSSPAVPHGSGRGCDGAPEHHAPPCGRKVRRVKPSLYEERPTGSRTWEVTGLLGSRTRTATAASSTTTDEPHAASAAGQGNELVTFNRDILVLANPEIASFRAG
jgi:cation/acetate symporter